MKYKKYVFDFGERVKSIRKKAGLSLEDFAKSVHAGRTTVVYWEKGKIFPSYWSICEICSKYNVSADWLLGLSEKMV